MKRALLALLLLGCGSSVGTGVYRVEARAPLPGRSTTIREIATPPPSPVVQPTHTPLVERGQLSNGMPVFVLTRRDMPTVSFAIAASSSTTSTRAIDFLFSEAAECALYTLNDNRYGKSLAYWDSRHAITTTGLGLLAYSSYLAPIGPSALDLWLEFLGQGELDGDALQCAARAASRLSADSSSATLAHRAMTASFFPAGHPLSAWTSADLSKITPTQIRQRAADTFLPARSAIVAVGDISLNEVTQVAERRWGKRSVVGAPELPPAPATAPRLTFLVQNTATRDGVFVAAGAIGVAPSSPEYPVQRVALALLEDEMFRRLRVERGDVYTVDSNHRLTRQAEVTSIGVHVPVDQVQASLDAMAAVLSERLAAPPSAGLLAGAKEAARKSYLLALDSNSDASMWLAQLWGAGLDPTKLDSIAHAVDAVDAAAVQRYMRAHWAPDITTFAVAGPLGNDTQLHPPQ